MHSLAKKFMMARKLKFGEDGKAQLLDHDYLFIDGHMLYTILETAGAEQSYTIGQSVGTKIAGDMQRTGLTGSKLTSFMCNLLAMMGLGTISLEQFDVQQKHGEIHIRNSLPGREALAAEHDEKACPFTAGMIAAMFAKAYDQSFQCEEKGCIAEGNDLCRFTVQPKKQS